MTGLHPFRDRLRRIDPVLRTGRVRQIFASHVEADGPNVPLGALCGIAQHDGTSIEAEVVRVGETGIALAPFDDRVQTFSGARVVALPNAHAVPVGAALLGRAVDALGRPIDGGGSIRAVTVASLKGTPTLPLERASPDETLETSIRAIDGLITLGKGQRVGIFAASGVGKTSLMGQLARQVKADVRILCLVGERGREVETIWNRELSTEARKSTTLVAATADHSAAMRVRASHYAVTLAEHWRDQGKHVLLLLDSATRLAMALREIGLAAGEPPTVRAYTPNVFGAIPKLVERCGALKSGGAITALMTVLSETDDVDDPVCELMKSLLDGHIVLSRTLAERGHFPAIDVLRSVSRQAAQAQTESHRKQAAQTLELLSLFDQAKTLIDAGLYSKGTNPKLDRAIERNPEIVRFLTQERDEEHSLGTTLATLARLAGGRP